MTTIALIHPDNSHANGIAEGLALMFGAGKGWQVIVTDDPAAERLLRGLTLTEYQDDPDREAERMAAVVARATLAHEREPAPA